MYDLIVIGAGPAGSAAARRASQLGLKTLLVEKELMPRNKLCGGGVTPKVLGLLDFKLPEEVIESVTTSARIHVGPRCFDFHSTNPLVYMTSRSKFDTLLATKAVEAGVEFKDGTLVRSIVRHASSIEVQTTHGLFEGMIVVGCDGIGGPTAKASGLYARWEPSEVAYAIESEVPIGNEAVLEFMGAERYFDVYFGVSPAGYGWVFPKDDHLTVGVGCRLSKLRDGPQLFKNFVDSVKELDGCDIPSPQAHLVPLGGAVRVPVVGDRVLLAGDSAGFAEALLGEGIYFAIQGGQIAAEVVAEACRIGRFDAEFLGSYERRWRDAFGIDFDSSYKLARVSYLENYDMDRLAKFLFSAPKFHECMIGLLDGSIRYRDVPTKLVWLYLKYKLAKLGLPVPA